eukprot:symbB.v1.2.015886.t1/scaffold1199.1/size145752/13
MQRTKKSQRCLQLMIICQQWKKRRRAALRRKNLGRIRLLVGMQISSQGSSACKTQCSHGSCASEVAMKMLRIYGDCHELEMFHMVFCFWKYKKKSSSACRCTVSP